MRKCLISENVAVFYENPPGDVLNVSSPPPAGMSPEPGLG